MCVCLYSVYVCAYIYSVFVCMLMYTVYILMYLCIGVSILYVYILYVCIYAHTRPRSCLAPPSRRASVTPCGSPAPAEPSLQQGRERAVCRISSSGTSSLGPARRWRSRQGGDLFNSDFNVRVVTSAFSMQAAGPGDCMQKWAYKRSAVPVQVMAGQERWRKE